MKNYNFKFYILNSKYLKISRIGFYLSFESNPNPTRTRINFSGFGLAFFFFELEFDNFTSDRIGPALNSNVIAIPNPTVTKTFASIQYIMTEANFGWLIRSAHR